MQESRFFFGAKPKEPVKKLPSRFAMLAGRQHFKIIL